MCVVKGIVIKSSVDNQGPNCDPATYDSVESYNKTLSCASIDRRFSTQQLYIYFWFGLKKLHFSSCKVRWVTDYMIAESHKKTLEYQIIFFVNILTLLILLAFDIFSYLHLKHSNKTFFSFLFLGEYQLLIIKKKLDNIHTNNSITIKHNFEIIFPRIRKLLNYNIHFDVLTWLDKPMTSWNFLYGFVFYILPSCVFISLNREKMRQ